MVGSGTNQTEKLPEGMLNAEAAKLRVDLRPSVVGGFVGRARQTRPKSSLPKVVRASVPLYPELARQTHIQGIVRLRVSTDGKRVAVVEPENGHRLLTTAATENVKTWEFNPHAPASFDIKFQYRLLDLTCDSECKCESVEKESVVLQLPNSVEVTSVSPMLCDPAVDIHRRAKKKPSAKR